MGTPFVAPFALLFQVSPRTLKFEVFASWRHQKVTSFGTSNRNISENVKTLISETPYTDWQGPGGKKTPYSGYFFRTPF